VMFDDIIVVFHVFCFFFLGGGGGGGGGSYFSPCIFLNLAANLSLNVLIKMVLIKNKMCIRGGSARKGCLF